MPKRDPVRRSPRSSAATITLVAARAGVSIATVSRVFAHPTRVSSELRQRVHHAARALGYQPSRVARSLRVGSSRTVGVVIPDIQNPFFTGVVWGIESRLHPVGYTLLLANSDEIPEREATMLATLRAEGVAGIVFVPLATHEGAVTVADTTMPMVAVDRMPHGLRIDLVVADNIEASCRAVAHLLSLGHRDVGLISGPRQHSTATERQQGYLRALERYSIAPRADLIRHGDFREAGGYDSMRALLALPHQPSAVFVANNLMTLGALRALHEAGCRVPGDVALVGFDDMPWAASLNPPLTAVAQPAHDMGATAAELLLARIREPDRPIRRVVVETTLIVRASCGAVSGRAEARAGSSDPARQG